MNSTALSVALCLAAGGCGSSESVGPDSAAVVDMAIADQAMPAGDMASMPGPPTTFFIASEKGSANLGGLAGADARCKRLAAAVGQAQRTWRAYLSTAGGGGEPQVNARDRIGKGPWYNVQGDKIADSVDDLHGPGVNLNKMTALDEMGRVVNGRGDTPNEHDILTGSKSDGRVDGTRTCADWTSEAAMGQSATVGHHDRDGGGADPMSWNAAHASSGCSAAALVSTGGAGHIYCFAAD